MGNTRWQKSGMKGTKGSETQLWKSVFVIRASDICGVFCFWSAAEQWLRLDGRLSKGFWSIDTRYRRRKSQQTRLTLFITVGRNASQLRWGKVVHVSREKIFSRWGEADLFPARCLFSSSVLHRSAVLANACRQSGTLWAFDQKLVHFDFEIKIPGRKLCRNLETVWNSNGIAACVARNQSLYWSTKVTESAGHKIVSHFYYVPQLRRKKLARCAQALVPSKLS